MQYSGRTKDKSFYCPKTFLFAAESKDKNFSWLNNIKQFMVLVKVSHPDFLVSFESFLVSLPLIAAVLLKLRLYWQLFVAIPLSPGSSILFQSERWDVEQWASQESRKWIRAAEKKWDECSIIKNHFWDENKTYSWIFLMFPFDASDDFPVFQSQHHMKEEAGHIKEITVASMLWANVLCKCFDKCSAKCFAKCGSILVLLWGW